MSVTLKDKYYIAGPFFNEEQKNLIGNIERMFLDLDIPFFSPRLCDENSPGNKIDDAAAARIFDRNYAQLVPQPGIYGPECDKMLAVIDYTLPKNQQLCVASKEKLDLVATKWNVSPTLYLPDTGTVFEIGMACALHIPVYAFTENPPERMNIMLSQSTEGIIHGLDHLRSFLQEKTDPLPYKGKHV